MQYIQYLNALIIQNERYVHLKFFSKENFAYIYCVAKNKSVDNKEKYTI